MNEAQISEATLQASLRDIRLPSEAQGGLAADLAATLAFASLAALIGATVWRLATRAKPVKAPTLRRSLNDLPKDEDARRLALLRLLKTHAPDRFAALRPTLYAPGPVLDVQTLEAELKRHV